jgi:hypothetical protein
MSDQLGPMIALYKEHVQGQRDAQATIVRLKKDLHEQEFALKQHSEFLKALTPVLHRLEGGSAAMNEAMRSITGQAAPQLPAPPRTMPPAADRPSDPWPAAAVVDPPAKAEAKRKS